jgi:hypothetical protein
MNHIVEKECRVLCEGERKRTRVSYVPDCFRELGKITIPSTTSDGGLGGGILI